MHRLAFALVAMLLAIHPAGAAEFGTHAEAVAMVQRVQKLFATAGAEATFKAVDDKSNPAFHDRDLYPFIYDLKGVCVSHGARPALIGKNLISLAKGPGSGWVDYKWPNPITNKIEDKSSYVEKMGDYFVGVGVYLIQEMIALAKGPGNGWVDYKWPNPITNKIEDKASYIEKMGDYFVGVGVYRDLRGKS